MTWIPPCWCMCVCCRSRRCCSRTRSRLSVQVCVSMHACVCVRACFNGNCHLISSRMKLANGAENETHTSHSLDEQPPYSDSPTPGHTHTHTHTHTNLCSPSPRHWCSQRSNRHMTWIHPCSCICVCCRSRRCCSRTRSHLSAQVYSMCGTNHK